MAIDIVRTVKDLRDRVHAWRGEGLAVGLVPTMGGLHEGHLSLVRLSLKKTERTIVTIFVNPKQFSEGEDFAVYPRHEDADAALLTGAGAHLLFAPTTQEMYADGYASCVSVPGIGAILEGEHRPGFFTGVATVVAKLLLQALPDSAFFGEKDYQQLLVIRRMVDDLNIPVAIRSGPTVREADGLAMSSRNAYLTAKERLIAPALYAVLTSVAGNVADGAAIDDQTALGRLRLIEAGFAAVDYLEVRDAETLAAAEVPGHPARALAAVRLGKTRLIDNVAL
ncbi:MAG: pantoate--beta-alanine ligase [Rhodospirillales bacterium RIFCSPLOWO2_12_FULL_58_28]|nr:MAG: pantoate--beta-alanine ligase [Rhodospirillales bacterium RIFCSPLOWO2_02_FULL_58_16]OHC79124.1 MAG: pantoate--beta-alanine ligase [Rhodospirillales bacterium RIFCSPLOWO2_12_FULL_58_28]